ncbi:PRTRC system protein E [Flavobacterium undicola]|uniref:PRTRC system protein E n=1 Tax=Flavobacterium undicola TaxID=1932779 RepID=UPI0013772823|nr:PRTRC system protein E [Flavobacterium undicola]MBA0885523.1 PRTRC system protein E [Flavobacterium undicola]
MNTNFFNQIAELEITGDLQLTISRGVENKLVVSILLQNEQCGDNAKQLIPPLNLRGTADELDEGFFESIAVPLQTASGLMVNMEAYMKQLENAQKQSAMEKEKTDKEKKAKDEKEKKYKEAIAKADELDNDGKPRDAWMKVPNPNDYSEYAEAINKRKKELYDKFASPSLFGAEQENV